MSSSSSSSGDVIARCHEEYQTGKESGDVEAVTAALAKLQEELARGRDAFSDNDDYIRLLLAASDAALWLFARSDVADKPNWLSAVAHFREAVALMNPDEPLRAALHNEMASSLTLCADALPDDPSYKLILDEALACYRTAEATDAFNDVAVAGVGSVLLNLAKLLLDQYEAAVDSSDNDAAAAAVAVKNQAIELLSQAADQLEKAAELDPTDYRYPVWLGEVHLCRASTYDDTDAEQQHADAAVQQGVQLWRKALDLDPGNKEIRALLVEYDDTFEDPGDASDDSDDGSEENPE